MQASKINHSTPDKGYQSQRSNSNIDDDIFFDMDGVDTVSSTQRLNTSQILPQSDDDDDIDNDDRDISKSINF